MKKQEIVDRYSVTIEDAGCGMLMHKRDPDKIFDPHGRPIRSIKHDFGTPEEQAKDATYLNGDGAIWFPNEWIYQMMVKISSQFRTGGQNKKTYRDNVKGLILIEPLEIMMGIKWEDLNKGKTPRLTIDGRIAKIQRTGMCMRYRPHLHGWQATFDVVVLDPLAIPGDVVHDIIERGGVMNGLGDYRPRFGRFVITKFEKVNK